MNSEVFHQRQVCRGICCPFSIAMEQGDSSLLSLLPYSATFTKFTPWIQSFALWWLPNSDENSNGVWLYSASSVDVARDSLLVLNPIITRQHSENEADTGVFVMRSSGQSMMFLSPTTSLLCCHDTHSGRGKEKQNEREREREKTELVEEENQRALPPLSLGPPLTTRLFSAPSSDGDRRTTLPRPIRSRRRP